MSDFKFVIGDRVVSKTMRNISFRIDDRIDFNGFMYHIIEVSNLGGWDYSRQWVHEEEIILDYKYYRELKLNNLLK